MEPEVEPEIRDARRPASNKTIYATVAVLFCINLLNYMDRFTIAGVLTDVQKHFDIVDNDSLAGLIQTSFIISYMIFSPVVGYLGDRYSRKWLMAAGILFWCAVSLSSSFIPPGRKNYTPFLILRALVGIGEASYATIAPTIIADLCVHDQRTQMLMCFYFAIPVGSGMGYIVGSKVAQALGSWQWALRVTPGLGVLCVIGVTLLVRDPPRGESEGHHGMKNTPLRQDLAYLMKNKSFVLSSLGFVAVAFVAGSLALWVPKFMQTAYWVAERKNIPISDVSLYFGIVTVATGFMGVAIGAQLSRFFRRYTPRADPLVCAVGMIASGPMLFLALVTARYNIAATFILVFFGELFLFLNWSIVPDILLYVVIPNRRSIAEAVQILVGHALGDAGSPFLIGVLSDVLRGDHDASSPGREFVSLQRSLYCAAFVCVLGGFCFLLTALYVLEDRTAAEQQAAEASDLLVNEPDAEHDDPTFSQPC